MIFDTDGNVLFRQSWLDTAFRCPERGRLAIVRPEFDKVSSDSSIIGTAAHAGIERTITGAGDPMVALEEAIQTEVAKGVKWTKYSTLDELRGNAIRCYGAWLADIHPVLSDLNLLEGARAEVTFTVPLFTHSSGRKVSITGTVDFVPAAPVLWDWKTAAQPYRPKEKQKHAIQPTIYSLAAVKGGLGSDVEYRWSVDFVYGVMVRGVEKAKAQMITVRRTEEHADFAIRRLTNLVDLAERFGLDREWPMDDDHFLCSGTWCPWWSICKGAHGIDDSPPPGGH